MFFVMVEISNYRQLSKLRTTEAADLRDLLEHFCLNRGGKLAREQSGFFLFSFHPLREKVLEQVADFLSLTSESLQKKREDLFGFSLLLEQDDQTDEGLVFGRLKALIFQAPRENRVWAGPRVAPILAPRLPLEHGEPLSEILGPLQKATLSPLTVDLLLEMTGWVEALKTPLRRQLAGVEEGLPGKILRLKGSHLNEKFFVLKSVLHQLYGVHEDFPLLFPLENSRDFLSQLLARIDPVLVAQGPRPAEPAWQALLTSGGDYPGDSGREDVIGALSHYFRILIRNLSDRGLPPVFVFLVPHQYEPQARTVLDTILGDLVSQEGLRLLLLEPQEKGPEFLGRHSSLSWTFPTLTWERILQERDNRGWQDRFPELSPKVLEACQGRGLSWVHHLWSLQEGTLGLSADQTADPSWTLFQSLDSSHHKVYYVLWAGHGLLEESQLVEFFEVWGDDPSVIEDKVRSLVAMGFFLGGVPRTLRNDFGPWLTQRLGQEGRDLLRSLGGFLYQKWKSHHNLSEILFADLGEWGLPGPSNVVLDHYLTNKINQGQRDFLPLLRPRLWQSASEERAERLRLTAASAKLRYSLNLRRFPWNPPGLDRFRRFFTPKTEGHSHGEWHLQQGRFLLKTGDIAMGFTLLKKALLEAQEQDNKALEVRAETEIGLALFRKHRMEEGREYFEIASRLADKTGSSYLVTITSSLDAVALFLLGNLSGSLGGVRRGIEAADRGGLRQWKVFLWFLKARVEFDHGDYSAAAASLDEAARVAERYGFHDALPVLRAWKGRTEAYSGNGSGARALLTSLGASAERSFFLAEASYHDQDWSAALAFAEEARRLLVPTQPFGLGENVDWTSGFSSIEDRALAKPGDMGVLENQIQGFQLLLEGLGGNPEEASRKFQVILARKSLLDLDPVSAQFFFWYYLVLPKHDLKQEAQRLTLLGRSLKDVQVRSSRIEDPGHRQDYLSKPYWNSQFSREARKLKLL